MGNTTFRELADSVFLKIKDLDLSQLPEDTAYQIVIGYMKPACVQFQSCSGQDLSDRDDEMGEFNFRLTDTNFELLSNYMVVSWLDSQILTTNNLRSRLTSSDFKSLNLHNQLSKLMELRTMLKSENDQLAINKSYINSDIFNIVTKSRGTKKYEF